MWCPPQATRSRHSRSQRPRLHTRWCVLSDGGQTPAYQPRIFVFYLLYRLASREQRHDYNGLLRDSRVCLCEVPRLTVPALALLFSDQWLAPTCSHVSCVRTSRYGPYIKSYRWTVNEETASKNPTPLPQKVPFTSNATSVITFKGPGYQNSTSEKLTHP